MSVDYVKFSWRTKNTWMRELHVGWTVSASIQIGGKSSASSSSSQPIVPYVKDILWFFSRSKKHWHYWKKKPFCIPIFIFVFYQVAFLIFARRCIFIEIMPFATADFSYYILCTWLCLSFAHDHKSSFRKIKEHSPPFFYPHISYCHQLDLKGHVWLAYGIYEVTIGIMSKVKEIIKDKNEQRSHLHPDVQSKT